MMTKEDADSCSAFVVSVAIGAPKEVAVNFLKDRIADLQKQDVVRGLGRLYDIMSETLSRKTKMKIIFGTAEKMRNFILERANEVTKEVADKEARDDERD